MNQKNSLGLNKCFLELDEPFELFEKWFDEAKKKEINDPNALALGTVSKSGVPSVRMVLLKNFDKNGFVFYTNLNSQKGNELKHNPNATMCFHWKSLLRQIRIVGTLNLVENKIADDYFNRPIKGWNIFKSDVQSFYEVKNIFNRKYLKRDYLWPISQNELLRNPNLVQNPGW